HPVAVVASFLPAELMRDLDGRHPRLQRTRDGGLQFAPGGPGLRLSHLMHEVLPFHGPEAVPLTARIFRALADDARARGAVPLVLIPGWGPPRGLDQHPEAWLVREIFERPGIEYVLGDFPTEYLIPGNPHPGPRGAEMMAQ